MEGNNESMEYFSPYEVEQKIQEFREATAARDRALMLKLTEDFSELIKKADIGMREKLRQDIWKIVSAGVAILDTSPKKDVP